MGSAMKQSGGGLSFLFILWMVLALSCSSPAAVQQTLPITVISLTSPVNHGNAANISVRTAPNAACTITVTYKSGPSLREGWIRKLPTAMESLAGRGSSGHGRRRGNGPSL